MWVEYIFGKSDSCDCTGLLPKPLGIKLIVHMTTAWTPP